VCHEGYHHWFVDDEIVTVAKTRQTFQMALGAEVEHIHPMGGKAPNDEVYDLGAAKSELDEKHFKARFNKYVGK